MKTQSVGLLAMLGLIVASLSCCPGLWAQGNSGTITGIVTDSSGAVVQGVMVSVTQVERNATVTLVSNEQGIYEAKFLPIGEYHVSAEKAGFKKVVAHNIILNVGQVVRVDLQLVLGSTQESVVVTAPLQSLDTETSEVGQVINQKQVADLPLNGRNFADLIPLNAGVTTGIQGGANGGYNFNGSRSDQNMFLIEGIDDISFFNNLLVNPTLESIEQFQVLTGNYSAEYGRSAGGIVTVKLKSGTNDWHGSLFEFLRNEKLDANGFFNNQVASPTGGPPKRQPLKRNQFGGSFSGPIVKDKTFFFADYQGTREVEGKSTILSVPTALERTGDFSQTLRPNQILYQNALLGQPYPGCNPAAFTPATCQVMPSSGTDGIDPVAAKVIALYPSPNRTGTFIPGQGTINNFATSGSSVSNISQFDVKIDHHLTSRDSLAAHYAFNQPHMVIPVAFGDGTVGPCINCGVVLDLLGGIRDYRIQNFGVTEVHTFSSQTVNEFRAGATRNHTLWGSSDGGKNLADQIGLRNVNVSPLTTGLPWFFMSPSPSWTGTSPFTPALNGYLTYQFDDNFTHLVGKHALKMGFDLRRRLENAGGNFFGKGAYIFVPFFTGNAFADFLSGRALIIEQDLTPGAIGLREIEYAGYFQDDFKVSRRLTLNLGLRYELFPGLVEVHNHISTIDPAKGVVTLAGVNGAPRQFVNTSDKNFGPRVGFAWSLNQKATTVLRGGYGLSYSNFLDPIEKAGLNPPYTQSFNTVNLGATFDAAYFVKDGLPVQLAPTPANFNPNNPSGTYREVARNAPTPYTQFYSLNIQKALPGDMMLQVGYVGGHGVHLPGETHGNPAPPGPQATLDQRRIYHSTIPNVTAITLFENVFSSSYNSLQTQLVKRFSGGLQFMLSYTWGRSIDNLSGSEVTGGGGSNSSAFPQNPFDLKADRAVSTYNRLHSFVGSYSYELPMGRGKVIGRDWGRLANGILGGWQLNGILTLQSGLPFSVLATSSSLCGCSSGDLRANLIPGVNPHLSHPGPNGWFNKAAFQDPVLAYGDSGRNLIIGPGYANFDSSLFKKFNIRETQHLEFRLEFFNVLNRTNFLNPVNAANSSWTSGGILTQNLPPRIGQVALKYAF